MADKNISIKIKADAKDAEKGIDKVTSAINTLGKSKTVNSIGKLGTAFTGLKNITSTVTKAVQAAAAAVNDTIEAYNKQAQAETQLEAAAMNNPYLNTASVQKLKGYFYLEKRRCLRFQAPQSRQYSTARKQDCRHRLYRIAQPLCLTSGSRA